MSDRKPRGAVPRAVREQRTEDLDRKRGEDQKAEDKALDDMVKRSIERHGA